VEQQGNNLLDAQEMNVPALTSWAVNQVGRIAVAVIVLHTVGKQIADGDKVVDPTDGPRVHGPNGLTAWQLSVMNTRP